MFYGIRIPNLTINVMRAITNAIFNISLFIIYLLDDKLFET